MLRSTLLVCGLFVAACSASAEGAGSSAAAADSNGGGGGGAAGGGGGAAPIALGGSYRSNGGVEPNARVTVDVVDTRQADASQHLADLQAGGASCFFVGADTYRCTSVSHDVPDSSLAKIAQSNAFAVSFDAPTAPPALVSQADALTEWQINQSGSSDNGSFAFYRYLDMGGGLVKIVLPDGSNSGQGTELIVRSSTEIEKLASTTVTESHWRFFEDSALVILQ